VKISFADNKITNSCKKKAPSTKLPRQRLSSIRVYVKLRGSAVGDDREISEAE
jgi:hypothetical protein